MPRTHGRLATLLFAGTAVQSRKKDAPLASCRLEKLRRPIKSLIAKHRGYLLELNSGELFAYFHSAHTAFQAARDLQQEFTGKKNMCSLRIGLHLGEVQINKKQVFGNDVNIASRLMCMAKPGGICVSEQVYQYVHDKTNARFVSLGPRSLKNIDGKIRIYSILPKRWCSRLGVHRFFHQTASRVRNNKRRAIATALFFSVVSFWLLAGDDVVFDEDASYLSIVNFENLTPENLPGHLAHGVEDAVKSQLASVPGLYLVPEQNRNGANVQLHVSLQQVATRLRASYRIINLADGVQLAGDMTEGDRADLFHLQDELADAIVTDLAGILALNDMELVRPGLTEDNKAYAYYLQAREYLEIPGPSSNTEYAKQLFESALEVDPHFARALAGLCELYWLEYEHNPADESASNAERSCQQAVELDPQLVDVQLALGRLYAGKGQQDMAIEAFQRAIAIDPRSDHAYRGLSRVYMETDQTEKALSACARAVSLRPGYWLNYKELGNLYLRIGQYDKADHWYRSAIELTPDNVDVHSDLGVAMFLKGDFQQAITAYRQSLALKPTAPALTNMGDAYYHLGDFEQAYLLHQRAVEAVPENYLYWSNLGNSRRQLYQPDEGTDQIYRKARELARKSLVVNPRNATAWLVIGLANAYLKEPDDAVLALRRGMEMAPDNLDMKYQSALVWNALGDASQALGLLETVIKGGFSISVIESNPELKTLIEKPRYQLLVESIHKSDSAVPKRERGQHADQTS